MSALFPFEVAMCVFRDRRVDAYYRENSFLDCEELLRICSHTGPAVDNHRISSFSALSQSSERIIR